MTGSCKVPASRLDKREDFCTCRTGTQVDISICPDGVKAPAENRAYEKARKAAVKNGSLIGATYEGQPMCVMMTIARIGVRKPSARMTVTPAGRS